MAKTHMAYMPKVISHRGAAGTVPENTMAAFRHAAHVGAQAVELDATISSDGVVVVLHDFNVDRCSDGRGPVVLKPIDEIESLDAGLWFDEKFKGERIPRLDDVIEFLASRDMAINLEIKPTLGWEEPTARAIAEILQNRASCAQSLLVSSMSTLALDVFHDVMPDVPLGLIVYAIPENLPARLQQHHCHSLHCYYEFVTPALVKQVHDLGHRLHVYTVNDTDQADALFALGVDSIFTDFPERMLEKHFD